MIEFRHLRYFVAVAEELNFHRAADRLRVSQPALWRQIRDLELDVGVALLERLPRGIKLTPAGEAFLEETRRTLQSLVDARERAVRVAHGQIGVLRIAFNEIAAREPFLPQYFHAFRTRYPAIELQLTVMMSQRQQEALEHSEIDAGFMFHRPRNDSHLGFKKITEDNYVIAIPRNHRLATASRIRLSDLTDEPFISPSQTLNRTLHSRLMAACLAGGLSPKIVQYADNEHTMLNMVATGMGLCFVNSSCRRAPYPSGVVLKNVSKLSVPVELEFVWRKDNATPALMHFIELVGEMPMPVD
jgi:DNA-binding transcriptional LysR family regulator